MDEVSEVEKHVHVYDLLLDFMNLNHSEAWSCGFPSLDKHLDGGFRPGNIYVIGGRPGEGKTSLALSIARRMALHQGLRVIFVSLEMSKDELVERTICQEAKLGLSHIAEMKKKGELKEALGVLLDAAKLSFWQIEDSRGDTVEEISLMLEEKQATGEPLPHLVIIDHLQQSSLNQGLARADAIAYYLSDLKRLAKRKKVAVLLCSQLNRQVYDSKDASGGIMPQLRHLKSSGAIEEQASAVLLGYRKSLDEGLDPETQGKDTEYFIYIAKNRRGPQTVVTLIFKPRYFDFVDLGDSWAPKSQ